jgi:hypothetical protein
MLFQSPRLGGIGDDFTSDEFETVSPSMSGVIAASSMFFKATRQILRRSNVVAAAGTAENINPSHMKLWVGRDSNPQPTP